MVLPGREQPPAHHRFMYGHRTWRVLGQWLSELRWPPETAPGAKEGITWAELALDYEASTGHELPPAKWALEELGFWMGEGQAAEQTEQNELFVVRTADGSDADARLVDTKNPWFRGDAKRLEAQRSQKTGKQPRRTLTEKVRTLSYAVWRLQRLLGHPVVPEGVKAVEKGIVTMQALDGHEKGWAGLTRRPVFVGGERTTRMLRTYAEELQTALQRRLWTQARQQERGRSRVGAT
eukprot:gene1948-1213_t